MDWLQYRTAGKLGGNVMMGEVYVVHNWRGGNVGVKTGSRTKYFNHEWNPPQFEVPTPPNEVFEAIHKVKQGAPLDRAELPEAAAIWNEKAFARQGDLTAIGGFYAVRGRMAEVLLQFDLGEGSLIPVPLFKDDLITPWPEPVWWVNFGANKECFLPEESKGVRFLMEHRDGYKVWTFNGSTEDDMIAVSPNALTGSVLWIERGLLREIFISGDLMRTLAEAKIKPKLRFSRVRIVGDHQ
ncbi:MAG: hypothetical protein KJ872_09755 [Alphaproteobacteria bacterium]|nr:hypothetical protein [Alphaproteobacteria bacterium]